MVVGEGARVEVVRGGVEVGGVQRGFEFVEILQMRDRRALNQSSGHIQARAKGANASGGGEPLTSSTLNLSA